MLDKVNSPSFRVGQQVAYPGHGLAQITSIESDVYAGFKVECFVLRLPDDTILRVPKERAVANGMRHPAKADDLKPIIKTLKGNAKTRGGMWVHRRRLYMERIGSGDVIRIAEVVRDLHTADMSEPSYSERRLYERALNLLVGEVAVSKNVSLTEAANYLSRESAKDLHYEQKTKGFGPSTILIPKAGAKKKPAPEPNPAPKPKVGRRSKTEAVNGAVHSAAPLKSRPPPAKAAGKTKQRRALETTGAVAAESDLLRIELTMSEQTIAQLTLERDAANAELVRAREQATDLAEQCRRSDEKNAALRTQITELTGTIAEQSEKLCVAEVEIMRLTSETAQHLAEPKRNGSIRHETDPEPAPQFRVGDVHPTNPGLMRRRDGTWGPASKR